MTIHSTRSRASFFVRPLAALLVLAAAIAVAACAPDVVVSGEGGSGTGGGGGGVPSSSSGTIITPVAPTALGVPYVLIQNGSPPPGATVGVGGGSSIDPNTLYVEIGNFTPTCVGGDPAPVCTSSLTWQVSVAIPPALQVPGVLQLSDPNLLSFVSESGSQGGAPGTCAGGGGSFTQGTLEILSIDADAIVVILAGTSAVGSDFDADGQYTAPICAIGGW
jgi:hypothetical protein